MCGKEAEVYGGGIHSPKKTCLECRVISSREMFTDVNRYEWVECTICGYRSGDIGGHAKRMHPDIEFKGPLKSQKNIDRVTGENNPGYQHGGRFSPYSINFVGYAEMSDAEKETARKGSLKRQGQTRKTNGSNPFTREYYDTDEEYIISQTRNLEWFVKKYGEVDGALRHHKKIERWMNSFKKCNFSKISQELFAEVASRYDGDVYFATKDRIEMKEYFNKEYVLKIGPTFCRPDFICLDRKKVIEFDGTYWHGKRPSTANPERERLRDERIRSAGYEILHIKELEYKENKENTIQKCLNFLTQ